MYNIEIPNTIHQIFAIFYRLRLWTIKDGATFINVSKSFYFIYFISFVVSMGLGVRVTDDKHELMFSIVALIITGVQVFRLDYILWKETKIITLIHQVGTHSTNDHEKFVQNSNKMKMLMTFSQYFILMDSIAFACTVIFPVVSSEKRLLFNVGFPIAWKNGRITFWITHAYIEVGVLLSIVCCIFTILVWYLMLNVVIKFDILGSQFRNIGRIRVDETTEREFKISPREQQKLYQQDFIQAIKTRRNIKEIIDQFASTFSNLFFIQIFTSSICICGSVYNLAFSTHDNLMKDGINCILLAYNLFDIFTVMYLGNEIKFSSDRLLYCLFESNWIQQTQFCKKLVLMLSELIKPPQEMIIGKLFPLNMATFTSIVNRAYSMFNILQNLQK